MVQYIVDECVFKVENIDPKLQRFDKVSRIQAVCEQLNMKMELDVNTDIYPLRAGDRFHMAMASTLNLDGTPDTGFFTQGARKSLADKFEYVVHGKIYRIQDASGPKDRVEILVSFGGLLMQLIVDADEAHKFELDQRVFLLIKKA